MGNEDVVACKNICSNPENKSDIDEMESITRRTENMNLGQSKKADDNETRVDFVQVLPMEAIEEIFIYLKPKDLAACAAVSTAWREAVNSNKVWGFLCDKNGWKDDFDPNFSHFYKSHKHFRRPAHSYDSFSPLCQKRLLFNKHSRLHSNWRYGMYVIHKLPASTINNINLLQMFEPICCDGRYIVVQKKISRNSEATLAVWTLERKPYSLCKLALPSKVHPVDAIAFSFETIAVAQAWIITVFHLKNFTFEKAFQLCDIKDMEPKNKLPKDMKRMIPYLRVTQDFLICVPSHSHSTIDFIPIFFWDRVTGELKHKLNFDSMYYQISNAVWFKDSCYLSLVNKKKKSYSVVEFSVKYAAWEAFSQIVTVEVENIVVNEHYVLAVTKSSNQVIREYFHSRSENNKELWLWDRTTGSALKTFDAKGKGFQFVDDCLMYFDSSKVTVMNPKAPNMCSEFQLPAGVISSIQPCCHPSLIVINLISQVEVWDWGLGVRLYSIFIGTGCGSSLWCDDQRIITYHSADSSPGGSVVVIGFW